MTESLGFCSGFAINFLLLRLVFCRAHRCTALLYRVLDHDADIGTSSTVCDGLDGVVSSYQGRSDLGPLLLSPSQLFLFRRKCEKSSDATMFDGKGESDIYIYMCIYIHMYICIYVCLYVYIYIW